MGKTDTGVQVRKHKNCSNLFTLAGAALRTLDERYIIRHIVQRKVTPGGLNFYGQRTGARFRLTTIRVESY